ncbi:deoxyribonuclease IV [Desulfoplanes sp.]
MQADAPFVPVFQDRLVGSHMPITGGLANALDRISSVGGTALQIFSRNQRQWKAVPLNEEDIRAFSGAWRTWGPYPICIHDSYLVNLAGTDRAKAEKSVDAFARELRRAHALGIDRLVTHPGSHLGAGVDAGLARYVRNLDRSIDQSGVDDVTILLETTAGQGTNLGACFEELAYILEHSGHSSGLGVCVDTCHVFAAGYDLSTPKGYRTTFDRFERLIGLDRLGCFHANDSKLPCGSRRDRHEHIGRGEIGLSGFSLLMRDERFVSIPMILETPKDKDLVMDRENLAVLKRLAEG